MTDRRQDPYSFDSTPANEISASMHHVDQYDKFQPKLINTLERVIQGIQKYNW